MPQAVAPPAALGPLGILPQQATVYARPGPFRRGRQSSSAAAGPYDVDLDPTPPVAVLESQD
eukprot:3915893-Lingulodinium_polyedra.AAC.1